MELRASAGPQAAAKQWLAVTTRSGAAQSVGPGAPDDLAERLVVPDAPDDPAGRADQAA
jgi:hypothetical protein